MLGSDDDGGTADSLPTVENPPGVVYVPSHREGVEPLGTVTDGPYEFSAMVSYAHPFWLVTGDEIQPVEVGADADVHLMVAVRDAETKRAIPAGGSLRTVVESDGTVVADRHPWEMLSQQMGLHAGDNVELEGDGSYDVTVSMPAPTHRLTGIFAGRFEGSGTATFSFEYDQTLRDALVDRISYVDEDERGVPGAIEPMGSAGGLPDPGELPGTLQGDRSDGDAYRPPRSDDADVPISVVEDFLGDGEPYLLVSPRTPYNRFPLPAMAPTTSVSRDGVVVERDLELSSTLDDAVGFHYGASIATLQPGDDLTIELGTRPGAARHQGYETAFLEMESIEVTLGEW
ncbi:iron transporter [Salinarchaeum chitinilyticum]